MSAPCRSSMLESPIGDRRDRPWAVGTSRRPRVSSTLTRRPLSRLRPARGPNNSNLKNAGTAPGRDRPGPSPFFLVASPAGPARSSLELDLRADLLQGGLDLLGLFLGDAFLDGLRRAFDEVLGLLQAERGDRADFLDDLDLLVADGGENDGELGLLLDRGGGGGAGCGSGGDRNRGGGRDAPLDFEELGEISGFENGQGGELVDDLFEIGHCACSLIWVRTEG